MNALRLLCAFAAIVGWTLQAAELDPDDQAEIHHVGKIRIVDPWAKSAVGSGHTTKLFFEFHNLGDNPDRLLDVRAALANGPTRFHAVVVSGGERRVKTIQALEIPVSDSIFELSEVGYYIELYDLDVPMLMGKRFPVELTFENAGNAIIEFTARFHSPKLTRRIREAAARGDVEALKAMRPVK